MAKRSGRNRGICIVGLVMPNGCTRRLYHSDDTTVCLSRLCYGQNRYKDAIDYGSTFVQQIVSSSTPIPLAAIGNVA